MNLVIVEDSHLVRDQLQRRVAQQPRISIVGTATGEAQAIDLILDRRPDAVLLDLALSPGSGLRVLEKIRAAGSGARVLVLSDNLEDGLRAACARLGVSGCYDKSHETGQCLDKLFSWLPPLPENEAARLRALRATELLDTPGQEVFDNITSLARTVTGCPMALISLVDSDRQWFLSRAGVERRENSRSVAFCAHTIAGHEFMEVPDMLHDPRFRDHPFVVGEPGVRFYAGAPLVLSSGEALGTLCVLDTGPRRLTAKQRAALLTLARGALGEIELGRRVIHLEREMARRQEAEAHVQHLATRDPLTALPNRTTFRDRLAQQLQQARRRERGLAVMLTDLDRFKLINDTLGHDFGDAALVVAADRLTDMLDDAATVARLGGDEFGIIVGNIGGAEECGRLAARVIETLAEPFLVKGRRLHADASIGIALFPDHGDTADHLLRRAELAMYQAKRLGGGRPVVFTPPLDERAEMALALEHDLHDAIARGELVAHFQPQAALRTGTIAGMEALVRWNHPHLGLLPPERFIPLAEERGLIHAIGARMLDLALAQLAAWDAEGLRIPRLSVNVSPVELRAGYAETVAAALARHGLLPERLELEITESTLTVDGVEVMRILNRLRERGISIAVDDFGVGYSSLGQLRRLPIDALKIDKSFVREVHENQADAAIVKAVVTMARAVGLRTVAEGTETACQWRMVEQLGCDCAQGDLLGKPMPAGEVGQWLRTHAEAGPGRFRCAGRQCLAGETNQA